MHFDRSSCYCLLPTAYCFLFPSASSNFSWIPPKPPLDIIATTSPSRSCGSRCSMIASAVRKGKRRLTVCWKYPRSICWCRATSLSPKPSDYRRRWRSPHSLPPRKHWHSHPETLPDATTMSAAQTPRSNAAPDIDCAARAVFRARRLDGGQSRQ